MVHAGGIYTKSSTVALMDVSYLVAHLEIALLNRRIVHNVHLPGRGSNSMIISPIVRCNAAMGPK